MSVLLVHLSDAHLKSPKDPLMQRAEALAHVVASECAGSVSAIVIAFTGDAIDKGLANGFDVASTFFTTLNSRVTSLTKLTPRLFIIPGNHDLVLSGDTSVRDVLISALTADAATSRPKTAIEQQILQPLEPYFAFASNLHADGTLSIASPYYVCVDASLGAHSIRFHLLNTSWMCNHGQPMGTLLFPLDEVQPPASATSPDYEIALLHHPFDWFKQPESMRPLRDTVEALSDLILTGHEHVGRATRVSVVGKADYEYREGEALQDGTSAQSSGFHVLTLDFENDRQTVATYHWRQASSGAGYVRTIGPSAAPLGRNRRRAAQAYRLRADFEEKLYDPELPVTHARQGRLRLVDFYTYPDIKRLGARVDKAAQFVRGDDVVATITAADTHRALLFGPDRCGKTSLAKMLFLDLHRQGQVPLLINGAGLKSLPVDRLPRALEELVEKQYELLKPELFWQIPPEKRVLILDDLQLGPADSARREELIGELERKFQRIVVLSSLEYFFEQLFPDDASSALKSSLMTYDHFRILPFGYVRCDRFVRNWIKLDATQKPDEFEEKVSQITGILTHFLRSNPIPQYPWVVMIIVQQADSPEPLHAENGSYGYLLQALITAALSRSKLKHPINGKYAWLGELANELYVQNRNSLSDSEARQVHERYLREYGVADLDYKEIRDDLDVAGVLRVDAGEVFFRQAYTYCYFVAWHLTQRIHAGDSAARDEVRRLCDDLGHEDTANVLVFLAHLTTSHVVVEEMTAKAASLFSDSHETDFATDVGPINNLYSQVQALVLPHGDPRDNKRALHDERDNNRAVTTPDHPRSKDTPPRPVKAEIANEDKVASKVMEIITALRAIEILGQVLRNEATARKLPEMIGIADHIFRLGRRLLGFFFTSANDQLEPMINAMNEHCRQNMPKARVDDIVEEVNRNVFNRYLLAAFAVVKLVSIAVGERNLQEVFRKLVADDPNLANRIYKLAIDLETAAGNVPDEVDDLNAELTGKTKAKGSAKGAPRVYNNLAHTLVRALVVDHLYLNHVPQKRHQTLCNLLDIKRLARAADPSFKRLPPPGRG